MQDGWLPNGVVWMTLLLGRFPFPFCCCCCCCLPVGALRRWSRLSVDPFRMARTFTEPRPGLQEPLVHVNLPPGAPGDAAIGCRLETTACCILATRTLADIVCLWFRLLDGKYEYDSADGMAHRACVFIYTEQTRDMTREFAREEERCGGF
jgi:hypothetical protein